MSEPYILEETDDYAVVFKPARMHCDALKKSDGGTLFEWFAAKQSVNTASLIHRLDFETHGLVLFAKNPQTHDFLKALQDRGEFIKEYSAVCAHSPAASSASGFPPYAGNCGLPPFFIDSFFRPFGPGRKLVRPVIDESKKGKEIAKDKGGVYRTEITGKNDNIFTVRLRRGFRHQIRCHLCWIGYPIQNDPLYPDFAETPIENKLALRANALFFTDPANGKLREFRLDAL